MSDDPDEEKQEDAEEQPAGKKGLLSNKLLLVGIAVVVILLGAGGGYFLFVGLPSDETAAAEAPQKPSVYYDLPEMVINLASNTRRMQFLKLKVALEAADQKAIDAIEPLLPRVLDMFQVYLRELRSDDLQGSAGVFRLKEELLRRINIAIHPNQVDRVLFKEIIVQ